MEGFTKHLYMATFKLSDLNFIVVIDHCGELDLNLIFYSFS